MKAKHPKEPMFVFGSNLAGWHGAGSALYARRYYGARQGVGFGVTGWAYAIPTKSRTLQVLPLPLIRKYVNKFIAFAKRRPDLRFRVCAIGTGLAGYTHEEIGPLFADAPDNCLLPSEWREYRIEEDGNEADQRLFSTRQ